MCKSKIDLSAGVIRMSERLNRIIAEAKSALSKAESCERTGAKWMVLSHGVCAVGHEVRDICTMRNYWLGKFIEEGYTMEKREKAVVSRLLQADGQDHGPPASGLRPRKEADYKRGQPRLDGRSQKTKGE